jgi:hypothetical protein
MQTTNEYENENNIVTEAPKNILPEMPGISKGQSIEQYELLINGKMKDIYGQNIPTIHKCIRFNCNVIGIHENGSMKRYAVGPTKDQITMNFCSSNCCKSFRWKMMDSYCKYQYSFPPQNYPRTLRNACIKWKKNGFLDADVKMHLINEDTKNAANNLRQEKYQQRQEQREREGYYDHDDFTYN